MTGMIAEDLLPDLPETDDQNLWLGLLELRDRLAAQLPRFPATSPVLLSGDWGSGKTTLLRGLERQFDKGRDSTEIPRTIFFEAWRYEGESLLLPALMRAIWDQLPEGIRESEEKLGEQLWKAAVKVAVGIGPSLAKIAGTWAGPLVAALPALLQWEKEKKPVGPPEDATKELWDAFKKLLEHWTPERPLIVFVDDLDRCSPVGAVALLDTLRMLLNQAAGSSSRDPAKTLPCRFVVALDRTVLAQAVVKKFADVSRYEGNRYLEKIFPISFDLPRPEGTTIHGFVNTFLQGVKSSAAAKAVPEDEETAEKRRSQLDALSLALSDRIFANPRLMKRCINRFRLLMGFEEQAAEARHGRPGVDGGDFSFEEDTEARDRRLVVLAKWIAATERWPHLRRLLSRRGDEYWHRFRQALLATDDQKDMPDAEARALLEEEGVETWLRREVLGGKGTRITEYREADQRLRKWGL